MKKEVEYADMRSGSHMMAVRGIALIDALEKAGYHPIPSEGTFDGDLFEQLIDDATRAGITVPWKSYDSLTRIEKRNFDSQVKSLGKDLKVHPQVNPNSWDFNQWGMTELALLAETDRLAGRKTLDRNKYTAAQMIEKRKSNGR